jgi:hypothetical protein
MNIDIELNKHRNNLIEDYKKLIDDEIFKQAIKAMEEYYGSGCETEIDAYFRGAKWMQKQFKQEIEKL